MGGGTGCYSHSQGVRWIRQRVAKFIENRDGYPADVDYIFLANGASAAIQMVLTALISGPQDGILIPIPQYPIYSALIALLDLRAIAPLFFPEVAALPFGPQLADHLAWGAVVGIVLRAGRETGQSK